MSESPQSGGSGVPVEVVTWDAFSDLRDELLKGVARPADGWRIHPLAGHIALVGHSYFVYAVMRGRDGDHPDAGFYWACPGCGFACFGEFGDQPVSGWDEPRWVNTGTREKPTLAPSLGCSRWRTGECPGGHYWLRDGVLVAA